MTNRLPQTHCLPSSQCDLRDSVSCRASRESRCSFNHHRRYGRTFEPCCCSRVQFQARLPRGDHGTDAGAYRDTKHHVPGLRRPPAMEVETYLGSPINWHKKLAFPYLESRRCTRCCTTPTSRTRTDHKPRIRLPHKHHLEWRLDLVLHLLEATHRQCREA